MYRYYTLNPPYCFPRIFKTKQKFISNTHTQSEFRAGYCLREARFMGKNDNEENRSFPGEFDIQIFITRNISYHTSPIHGFQPRTRARKLLHAVSHVSVDFPRRWSWQSLKTKIIAANLNALAGAGGSRCTPRPEKVKMRDILVACGK